MRINMYVLSMDGPVKELIQFKIELINEFINKDITFFVSI